MPSGVIFGGPSPEHDVSILIGLQVARALGGPAIYWTKTGEWVQIESRLEAKDFADGVPRNAKEVRLVTGSGGGFFAKGGKLGGDKKIEADAFVNCCHGGPGEDGTLQGLLDLAGVRYTGPSVAGAALGMDKLAFASVAQAAGLPVLPRAVLGATGEVPFEGPYIVKPRFGGSSIGVEVVADLGAARALLQNSPHLRRGALIEPFRAGAVDLEIAIRSHPEVSLSAISKPETGGGEIFDYRNKYVGAEGMASAPRECPAQLAPAVEKTVREAATVIATAAMVRGVARLDFLLVGDDVFVNEINTVPGSLAKHLWVDPVRTFEQQLEELLDEARQRPTYQPSTAGADGTILRSATSIANKLA